tara:strand:- start:242 stop:376 length:135 start_codon:yes stop_codon:yes gene_type:complete
MDNGVLAKFGMHGSSRLRYRKHPDHYQNGPDMKQTYAAKSNHWL